MLVDLQAPKRHLNGGTFKVFSDTSNKMLNVHYIYGRLMILMGWYTDSRESVLDEAGGE